MITVASWPVRVGDIVVFIAFVIVLIAWCARAVDSWKAKRKHGTIENAPRRAA